MMTSSIVIRPIWVAVAAGAVYMPWISSALGVLVSSKVAYPRRENSWLRVNTGFLLSIDPSVWPATARAAPLHGNGRGVPEVPGAARGTEPGRGGGQVSAEMPGEVGLVVEAGPGGGLRGRAAVEQKAPGGLQPAAHDVGVRGDAEGRGEGPD